MEIENAFTPAYSGTKEFDQHTVRNANATGFGAAADDYASRALDLNDYLISNKPSTFFLRIQSESMTDAGIHAGDLVIVDRSVTPRNGHIVIANLNGEMLIRRYEKQFNKVRLIPATSRLAPIDIDPASDGFSIWGVVRYTVHAC
ncbi:translesion error-prone DNA polymerase V autoproteolytic subunit [Flavihumibacter sp. CACIAM 22H1]|uniref:LexA family protein n=1 Tax=Flavihumibacter sp. CACIAM 22H1 TaxID=1812911 RepID=UPI0007A93210|nr:translesion error-prone DNA polymerase V autoproteolytic subunit [Flavihumibacter sp. CACIAM 22H1]KYP13163.1 MAG: peptidase S24 [Flavihumibacter sp. CACIAM 22H1]